ncbi:MAG TPA: DUF1573 domain-containing protein [Candidatus Paceibacterota bacterium]
MRTKNVIIFILVVVAALGFMFFYARPAGDNIDTKNYSEASVNVLTSDKTLHDFGTISMKDGNVKTIFKIKNPTEEILTLNKLYTSCMCTSATLIVGNKTQGPFGMPGHSAITTFNQTLKPNEEAQVEVVFDPNAHGPAGVGVIERTVILEGKVGKLMAVNIKVNVIP